MPEIRRIPFSAMQNLSPTGVFIKHFSRYGRVVMRSEAHRDDYYLIAFITDGNVAVDIDFEKKSLSTGHLLIVSPWQVHNQPSGETWMADGWVVAFSQDLLTEAEARTIEEYSISPEPINPGKAIADDINTLCSMMMRNQGNHAVSVALACAIKSIAISVISSTDSEISGRYKSITLRLRKLLDVHLAEEKRPSAYASLLNISEIYLNEAVKGATGLSAGTYIRTRAMIQARRQLAYTNLSTKEIAYSLGYDDYAYFSKLFKKIVGLSPSEFRKNLK